VNPIPAPETTTASATEVQLDLWLTLERLIAEADKARELKDRLLELHRQSRHTAPTPTQPRTRRAAR
jgi:hypothetical protein